MNVNNKSAEIEGFEGDSKSIHLFWGLLCLTVSLLLSSQGCVKHRKPDRYLIPCGYKGWVRVQYKVAAAPPLSLEDNHYLIVINNSGRARTSSSIEEGFAKDEYFYVCEKERTKLSYSQEGGSDGEIWGEADVFEGGKVFHIFFVGGEVQYKANPTPPDP